MIFLNLDLLMCLLWMLTYTLVFIGTIKHQYPLISPISQIFCASFEFSVFIKFIINGTLRCNYVSISYIYWTVIEIAIIILILKQKYIKKQLILPYILLLIYNTCIMTYFVYFKNYMFFFSYFNTLIGELFWLFFIIKKEYPMKPITLIIFISKFIADGISIPTYFGSGYWFMDIMCITLPILDFLFIVIYVIRKHSINNKDIICNSESSKN